MTQRDQVIFAMRQAGGMLTLGKLKSMLDFSTWKTKTPHKSVNRIVQESPSFFKVRPGLWALEECRGRIMKDTGLVANDKKKEQDFSHTYFQGLVVEIGNMKGMQTYVPNQDKNKLYIDKPLKTVATLNDVYKFTYDNILRRATTVDVVWFNERHLPSAFFEIEHSTDIQNSLLKYYDLQDYYAQFYIVADEVRHRHFDEIIGRSVFEPIRKRVKFVEYENLSSQYEAECKLASISAIL